MPLPLPPKTPGARYEVPNVGPGTVRRVVPVGTAFAASVAVFPYVDNADHLFDLATGAYLGRAPD